MNTKCPGCMRRVWWWQAKITSLGQKQHERCYWKRFFSAPKVVRK